MNKHLLILSLSILPAIPVNADELGDFCSRRAVGAVAELRHEHYPELSQREIEIARKSAIIACIDSRTSSSSVGDSAQEVVEQDSDDNAEEKKGWVDRLLDSEGNEDVSPMMGAHRNGGK